VVCLCVVPCIFPNPLQCCGLTIKCASLPLSLTGKALYSDGPAASEKGKETILERPISN
jgi:hypothetical protein